MTDGEKIVRWRWLGFDEEELIRRCIERVDTVNQFPELIYSKSITDAARLCLETYLEQGKRAGYEAFHTHLALTEEVNG